MYHDLFIFMDFHHVSSLFPNLQLLLHPFPFCLHMLPFCRVCLHCRLPFHSYTHMCLAYHWNMVFHFSQFLLYFYLMLSSYCLPHSPYYFPYLSTCVDTTLIVLIVFSYLHTVEQITINTPVCCRVTPEQESASSPNSSCDLHSSTIINSHTLLYTLHASCILITPQPLHTCPHLPTLCSVQN